MLLLIFIAILCSIISWRYPMAGLAIAINTHVFRSAAHAWILGRPLVLGESGFEIYSAAFLVPALGIPLIKLAWKMATGVRTITTVRWNAMDAGLIGLSLAVLLGCLYAPDADVANGIVIKFLGLGVIYYVFARGWMRYQTLPEVQADIFMKWTWYLALLAGFVAIIFPDLEPKTEELARLTTESANPIPFSLLMGTALLVNCYWLMERTKKTRIFRLTLLVSPAILIYFFVAANTRGPLVGFLVAFVFLVSGLLVQRKQVKTLIKIIAVVVFLIAVCWAVWDAAPDVYQRFGQRLDALVAGVDTVQEREAYYELAWLLFQDALIFGVGTGGVTHYAGGYAHNIILEVAAENGIIGLLPLLFFVGGIFYYYVFSALQKKEPLCIFFASCCIYYLVWGTASGTLFIMKYLYFVAGMLAFFAHYTGDRAKVPEATVVQSTRSSAARPLESYWKTGAPNSYRKD